MTIPDLGFIHRFVPPPPEDPGGKTLLLLHGTGGSEDDLIPLGRSLAPGAGLLSPRGKVLEQGMARYFRRLREGVFDHQDLLARTHELARFVNHAASAYRFDPQDLWGVGFSNGANIAGSLLLLYPGLLRGAILFRPMVPFEPTTLPDLSGTRVRIGAGRADPLVAPAITQRLIELFQQAGAEVAVDWRPGGHELDPAEVAAAAAWIQAPRSDASGTNRLRV